MKPRSILTIIAGTLLLSTTYLPAAEPVSAEREARLAWWHEAKFGMFIHWGLFDLALLRCGCQTLLHSAERLKIDDPVIPKWKDVLARLVDFPTDEHGVRLGSDKPSPTNQQFPAYYDVLPVEQRPRGWAAVQTRCV